MSTFEQKCLHKFTTSSLISENIKLRKWAENNKDDLPQFQINSKSFVEIYQRLYKKLSEHAHPYFDKQRGLILLEEEFKPEELRILVYLWSAVPLQMDKFTIQKVDGTTIISPLKVINTLQ